jgi:putative ABC transport system permease protein
MKGFTLRSPKLGGWLIGIIARHYSMPSLAGDFLEEFEDTARVRGSLRAWLWYWRHLLKSIPVFLIDFIFWRFVMFRNYLKISIRNITKNKIHSAINILGLTVGLACCLFILVWIQDELSYDRFNKNLDNLYRVILEYPKESQSAFTSYAAPAAAEWLKNNIPEIAESARFRIVANRPQILVKYGEKQYYEEKFGFGDAELFDLFTFPFLVGNPKTALSNPNSIVLSEDMARKYFGQEDPIGKVLNVENQYDFIVTGIMSNIPHNSHLLFDSLVPFENIESFMPEYGKFLHRHNLHFFRTYILVHEGTSIPELKEKVSKYLSIKFDVKESMWRHHLQPVKEIHLRTRGMKDLMKRGDIRYIYIFSFTGILVLLIACINFMNLSTARSCKRAKEVGMRKVVGAHRLNLIGQFFGEAVFSSLLALVMALIIVFASLPAFNSLTGKQIALDISNHKLTFIAFLLIALVTGLLSGSYPAVYLSSIKPVKVLKGAVGLEKGKGFLRKTMVVTQFVIAIGLIVCTLIIYNQYNYMRNINLGFDKEHIVYIKLNGNLKEKYQAVKNDLLQDAHIVNVAASSRILTNAIDWGGDFYWEGKEEKEERLSFSYSTVGYDFIETFKMEMVQGRSFSQDIPRKPNEEIIINEAAARFMNVESPVGLATNANNVKGTIIGVVKNYNFQSLHNEIRPLVLTFDPENFQFMHIRIHPDNIHDTIRHIEKICRTFEPGVPFEYHFLDEAFEILYKSEEQMSRLFNCLAVFAIFIACLGLFGLSLFIAESRFREIGIRKVLGASVPSLIELVSREFVVLVILANIIAWPVAYYVMNRWLQNFAYRTSLSAGTFLLSGFLAFIVSLITVSFQSIKAATANPVDSLRYE